MSAEEDLPSIDSLMTTQVMTVTEQATLGRVRELMTRHGVSSIPVVDAEGAPIGIVTSSDLLSDTPDTTGVGQVMTTKTYSLPASVGVDEAARLMRNQHIHHVLVVRDKKVAGILSTMDLLELVETHRFTLRNKKSKPRAGSGRRRRSWKAFE